VGGEGKKVRESGKKEPYMTSVRLVLERSILIGGEPMGKNEKE